MGWGILAFGRERVPCRACFRPVLMCTYKLVNLSLHFPRGDLAVLLEELAKTAKLPGDGGPVHRFSPSLGSNLDIEQSLLVFVHPAMPASIDEACGAWVGDAFFFFFFSFCLFFFFY
jgi:hypothetical protein